MSMIFSGTPPALPATVQQPDPGQAAKILVVDDSPTQAKLLEHVLTAHGYSVFVSNNGIEALNHILAHPPDLVISDILMPEMDSFEMCRQVRRVGAVKGLPIILLTHLNDPTDVLHSLDRGRCRLLRLQAVQQRSAHRPGRRHLAKG